MKTVALALEILDLTLALVVLKASQVTNARPATEPALMKTGAALRT